MRKLISLMMCLVLSSCTLSVMTIHSEGGNDLIDEDQNAEAQVSPDISIPALGYDYDVGGRDVGLV